MSFFCIAAAQQSHIPVTQSSVSEKQVNSETFVQKYFLKHGYYITFVYFGGIFDFPVASKLQHTNIGITTAHTTTFSDNGKVVG